MTGDDRTETVAKILRATAAAHHRAFSQFDGFDPKWPRWYAEHARTATGRALDAEIVIHDLAKWLARADREPAAGSSESDWDRYLAAYLSGQVGG